MKPSALPFLRCVGCDAAVSLAAAASRSATVCGRCGREYAIDDGILLLEDAERRSDYPDNLHTFLRQIEPRHFWFEARNRAILSALADALGPLEGRTVLDIGCGTGYVIASLERAGMVTTGLDTHLAALRYARQRSRCLLVRGSGERVPFVDAFDAVTLCDVIEHVSDDVALLMAASRALNAGGVLLVTVPADPRLWTSLDEVWGHKRRYTKEALIAALEGSGLRVASVRRFNWLLYPLLLLARSRFRGRAATSQRDRLRLIEEGFRVPPAPVDRILRILMRLDVALGRVAPSFGGSLVATAHRS